VQLFLWFLYFSNPGISIDGISLDSRVNKLGSSEIRFEPKRVHVIIRDLAGVMVFNSIQARDNSLYRLRVGVHL